MCIFRPKSANLRIRHFKKRVIEQQVKSFSFNEKQIEVGFDFFFGEGGRIDTALACWLVISIFSQLGALNRASLAGSHRPFSAENDEQRVLQTGAAPCVSFWTGHFVQRSASCSRAASLTLRFRSKTFTVNISCISSASALIRQTFAF